MKKLFVFSLLFLLGACAEGSIYKKYDQDCNDHFYSRKDCPAKEEKAKAPEKVYVYREARPEPRRITLVAQRPAYVAPRPAPMPAPAPVPVTTVNIQAPAPRPSRLPSLSAPTAATVAHRLSDRPVNRLKSSIRKPLTPRFTNRKPHRPSAMKKNLSSIKKSFPTLRLSLSRKSKRSLLPSRK